MILDQIIHLNRYISADDGIKAALKFIYSHKDEAEMPDGKYEIIKDQVTAFVVSKDTVNQSSAEMEIHKKFMDIHYVLKGKEMCCLADLPQDIESCSYDEEADITFFPGKSTDSITIGRGDFYAVWPYEPHKPLCNPGEKSEFVKKIICKVKIDGDK
ncbi:YhcH/YjgK/YiaL family protein [Clostridium boliviensis]|uniref:YhcH/YjgK/YiaL family protein n=1 Tax=Clostridium boliviensis TaxID=318465 RepID=A0ABU4GNH7_9CLOT|nr:YhcH/YjgK/YiaL family protein [Clostridium boliviensis]MDW2799172.1 YhcH/YjgK/YiaL family protein [Clostridium boliviensis]